MADAIEAIKGILGEDAEDKIKSVMGSLSGEKSTDISNALEGNEYLMQIKDIAERLGNSRDDPRTNLLMSLRPFMRDKRKNSIDSAVKLLNMAKLSAIFRQ